MPYKPKHPWQQPGCPNLCDGKYCDKHKKIRPNGDRLSRSAWLRKQVAESKKKVPGSTNVIKLTLSN